MRSGCVDDGGFSFADGMFVDADDDVVIVVESERPIVWRIFGVDRRHRPRYSFPFAATQPSRHGKIFFRVADSARPRTNLGSTQ